MPVEAMTAVSSAKAWWELVPVPWTNTIPGTRPWTPRGILRVAGIAEPSLVGTLTVVVRTW